MYDICLFKSTELHLWPTAWSVVENAPRALEKGVCFAVGWCVPHMSVTSSCSHVLLNSSFLHLSSVGLLLAEYFKVIK